MASTPRPRPLLHASRLAAACLGAVALTVGAALPGALPLGPSPVAAQDGGATTSVESISGLAQIGAGANYTCGLSPSGVAYCWGDARNGRLGNGSTSGEQVLPVAVTVAGTALDGKSIKVLEVGLSHASALAADGTVACWGENDNGELGDGTTDDRATPTALVTAGSALDGKFINQISAGSSHTCARASDGTLACWGKNSGRFGNGLNTDSLTPVAVNTTGTPLDGKAIAEIEAGRFNTCAVTTDGALACWGSGSNNALGNGGTANSLVPTSPTIAGTALDGKTVEAVAVGRYATCVLTDDETVACWGWGNQGQMGDGDTNNASTPAAVTTAGTPLAGQAIDAIESADDHMCVDVTGAGPVCWGANLLGQIGNGVEGVDALVPTAVVTANTPLDGASITTVTVGEDHTCVLHGAGQAACWGDDFRGALGRGDGRDSLVPVSVALDPAVPAAPTITEATAEPGTIRVAWTEPADGGALITDYIVRAYQGANEVASRTYTYRSTSGSPGNLVPGEVYEITVTAVNAVGDGPPSDRSTPRSPFKVPPEGVSYYPIDPCRIVDTREVGGRFDDREIRDYTVGGSGPAFAAQGGKAGGCGVPEGAVAVEASVTAVGPLDSGFFRAWPSDESMPNATFMNFDEGMDITNTGAITIVDYEDQQMRVRNFGGRSHYVIDLQGFYVHPDELGAPAPPGGATTAAVDVESSYRAITPCRIVDTREAGGRFDDREIRDIGVTGSGARFAAQGGTTDGCDIPAGAVAVEASITAVNPLDSGFFRAWPSGQSMPNATFMNFDEGMDITNTGALTIAVEPASGTTNAVGDHLRIRNFGGQSHYVIDIQGYFEPAQDDHGSPAATAAASDPSIYVPMVPCRILDTRQAGGRFADREIRNITVAGDGPAFAAQGGAAGGCDIPDGTVAIEASITAVDPLDSGFFRAWPFGQSMPNATFMNFDEGMDITNTGSVTITTPDFYGAPGAPAGAGASDEHLRIRNFGGQSHYVIDIQGFHFAAQLPR